MPDQAPTENIEELRSFVKRRGGEIMSGIPRFRLVFSDKEYEIRKGDRTIFTEGGLFLREEKSVIDRVPKYSYIQGKWILEKWVYSPHEELPESIKGHYEPFWVFQDSDGNPLPPVRWALEVLLKTWEVYKASNYTISPRKQFELDQEEVRKSEEATFEELNQSESSFKGKLFTGEGVGYTTSKNYERDSEQS